LGAGELTISLCDDIDLALELSPKDALVLASELLFLFTSELPYLFTSELLFLFFSETEVLLPVRLSPRDETFFFIR